MKVCIKCGRLLPLDNFHQHKYMTDGHINTCKDCRKEYDKARRSVRHNYRIDTMRYVDTLKSKCAKCGITVPYVLQFHHIDPSTKVFDLGKASRYGKESIADEVKKCICLCANCHRTFHYFYGNVPPKPVETLEYFLTDDWTPPITEREMV